jgi:putative transposase
VRPKRGPQTRDGDRELTAAIRRLVDARPTPAFAGLVLGWPRVYLWNGEVVRLAFALDCHDREVISWVATTAGVSGEMIRDMMVDCVERRFGAIRAPHPVQWLSDNGSIFAAHRTIEIALALNLVPCFTPVESPESNGMAEAFVKTLKRDYVRVSLIPNAAAALALVDSWMEDYNTVHPHSRLGYRSPREYILSQPVACSGLTGSTPIRKSLNRLKRSATTSRRAI